MKISLEWLAQYLPGPLSPEQAAHALTHGGLPVEVIERVGDDTVIDVEVTSNRPDCLCHVGVARELAALLGREVREVAPSAAESGQPTPTSVRIDDAPLCPHYTARVLRGVRVRPSPPWMQRRLAAVGLRPINNVVDVTNYVMFEMGQPLHAFDHDRLGEGRIVVRRARDGETLVSLDGHARRLTADMLVIADASVPVAVAGVMGGRDSEVSDATTNVLLESARFDPLCIRRTARALGMKSDSSYRFERGIDPTLPARASLRAAQLILDTAGGELTAGLVEAGAAPAEPRVVSLRLARLTALLGVDVPEPQAVDALARLGLAPQRRGDVVACVIPSHRLDLRLEVDLIEEVARLIGYERIPVRDEIAIRLAPPQPRQRAMAMICDTLSACGHFEAITVSFLSDRMLDLATPPEAGGLPRADAATRGADAHLRPSLLPGLLESIRRNESAGTPDARLFETGSTFILDRDGRVVETPRLALAGGEDYRATRGAVEAVLRRLDATRPARVEPDERPMFARGACGRVLWGDAPVGWIGVAAPAVRDRLDLRAAPAMAELDLAPLLDGVQLVPQLQPLPRYPSVQRDLSLVVPESMPFERVRALVAGLGLSDLESLDYVTTYRGRPLEAGVKSVTVTLTFRSGATTLTNEAVEPRVQQVVAAAREQLGAALRA